ncbi:type II toxin-antitoxin system HicB family antitoxin [Wansuia hejianensis]|uniref:Type II toxin-antitoxin system HicB family antitoxin n=1 Tax=Wansuia hejianensis TaxID=2763667 RepID=A0A7G9GB76_9FIRM|nr:type II toxin-antitoxin system HicB family antitoxin [Wansuia hejianensis]QNM08058.1 type II toxin-antitoxin system HicB family antitoxin [Wansuia hejianensis]RHV86958.1 type II toxin-antitoxin system HicB family antitoxin [Lachnospiraceae bacterium OF09-33XD]
MAKYVYPAVFTPEENGNYSILFPDLDGCYTCGDSLEDGIEMAEDALALILYGYEKDNKSIPAPSNHETIALKPGEFVNYIACDTMIYRKMYNNKAVKKTLTIPEWLNEAATAAGLNFSQVLQEALIQKMQNH